MFRSGSVGPLEEDGLIMFAVADAASGDGRGLDVDFATNIDLVPSTNRPPRGGIASDCFGTGLCGEAEYEGLVRGGCGGTDECC